MDENVTVQEQTTPEAVTEQTTPEAVTEQGTPEGVADDWDDEPILPDEGASDADEKSLEALFADAADAGGETETPSDAGTQSGNADAPSENQPDADGQSAQTPAPDYKALYEGLQERQNADRFRAIYNEQLAVTGNEAVARMVAMHECGGKAYPLEDAPESPSGNASPSANAGRPDADFRAQLTEIQALYPDAVEMPQAVMQSYMGGKPLKEAYASYRAAEDAKTITALRGEIAALKKTASNRAAAPVKGVNGDRVKSVDAFMQAFDEEF